MKSKITQGKTMKDVTIISDNLVAKRKGELFGRIKPSTLAKFIGETNNEESVFGLMQQNSDHEEAISHSKVDKENCDVVSTTGSVMSMGQESVASAITYTTEMLGVSENTKFILLDLRDEIEYKKWHIREAISFPAPNIARDKVFS